MPMNGPFTQPYDAVVEDDRGKTVAHGYGDTEEEAQKNAELICFALNTAYYLSKAIGATPCQ